MVNYFGSVLVHQLININYSVYNSTDVVIYSCNDNNNNNNNNNNEVFVERLFCALSA